MLNILPIYFDEGFKTDMRDLQGKKANALTV